MKSLGKPGDVSTFDLANKVNAIAYRPVTGDLLGFSSTGAVYSIDPASGKMKDLAAKFADEATIGDVVAFDFNNKIDAVRAVGKDGTNLVYFPGNFGDDRAGKVLRFTDTHYVDGDANTGKTPAIFANAYTNAIAGSKAGSTFQYALDAETNALVSLANNAGKLQTVGKVMIDGKPVDLAAAGGFDIVSEKEGTDAAFAVLQLEGAKTAGLYSVNLQSAEATLLADLGIGGVSGFAASGAR
ncbi:MAG: DUF4394 domain-containing protein [Pseudomonadota bacterium]